MKNELIRLKFTFGTFIFLALMLNAICLMEIHSLNERIYELEHAGQTQVEVEKITVIP